MATSKFVHLHLHSAYSLAEGAIRIPELLDLCQGYDMPAVAVTDTNNLFGALEFAITAAKSGVQPIIGCQIRVGYEGHEIVLLVQSEQGYKNLCTIVSRAFLENKDADEAYASWDDLKGLSEGLICLTGGKQGPVSQFLLNNQKADAEKILKQMKTIFADRLYVEIQRHFDPEQDRIEEDLIDFAYKHDIPLVAANDCYFATPDLHEAHDALLCIAGGRYVTESDRRKVSKHNYFKSPQEMEQLFEDLPEAIENTANIAQRCHFLLKPIDPILPAFDTSGGRTEAEELRAQSKEGLKWRLENFVENFEDEEIAQTYWDRLEYELGVIEQMGFPGYFLIVSDFIKWAKEQNIPVGPGRGSGAGSIVAWSLKITDLNPIQFGLIFERFLNPERISMPDFDIDFCQDRRDEVIQYVQEKYGYDRVAQIITFGKLQARAVVRDVGRVLQMPYGQVDRIAKMIPNNPNTPMTLQEAIDQDKDLRSEIDKEETSQKLISIALKLEGLYRHASTHAAGVVIGDRPLHELIPLYRDPRSEMPVTQFNMKFVEQAGLVKFDFLGLKTLTVIQKAVEYIKESKGDDIEILKIPLDDRKTFELFSHAETEGVFQFESAGMQDMLKKMGPDRFEDLIALVALYRPGPMDDIPTYISVKKGSEEADFLHEKIQPILEETYGVIVYQEQVMEIARTLSGYTLGGADAIRKAMGKKIKAEMDKHEKLFIEGAVERDIARETAERVFEKVQKFASYGFNKCHSGPYALIAYWTGWLKANYPVEFMAASMTLDKGNTDKLAMFKQVVDRMEIDLLPPDVLKSEVDFKVEGDAIRYALSALKGVGTAAMQTLIDIRKDNKFNNIYELVEKVPSLNKKQMEMLAAAGAYECLNPNRAQIYEACEMLLRHGHAIREEQESGQDSLFGEAGASQIDTKPPLPEVKDWDHLDRLSYEFSAVGFFLSAHPLDGREKQLKRLNIVNYLELEGKLQSTSAARVQMAGVLLKKQERISAKSGKKYAFLQISDATGVFEIMVFSETLAYSKEFLNPGELILATVDAEYKDDQLRMIGQRLEPLEQAVDNVISSWVICMADNASEIEDMKHLLHDIQAKDEMRIRIKYPYKNNSWVIIDLPDTYNLNSDARRSLQKLDCVEAVTQK